MTTRIIVGDALEALRTLPDESVHAVDSVECVRRRSEKHSGPTLALVKNR